MDNQRSLRRREFHEGKHPFANQGDAYMAIQRIKDRGLDGADRLYEYRCEFCIFHHIKSRRSRSS